MKYVLNSVVDPGHFGGDPSVFIMYLQDANKKRILKNKFFSILLFERCFYIIFQR
jgi:hypothetical protein